MSDKRLVVHHVGGRGGTRNFPVLPAFEKDVLNVMYDADKSCLPQIAGAWKTRPSETVVLPYCLGAKEGDGKFHNNYDPCTSSAYPLNPRYAPFYYRNIESTPCDYVLGDTVRTMEEAHLPTVTLDAVALDRGEVPGPDFLSIDTQGSELDILAGASRLLDGTILAVYAEVEFHPLYDGQPLFGDMCKFLAKRDFDLVDIQLFPTLLPMRGKQGFRGEGYLTHGEALFLKRPEAVAAGLRLNKLAFIATIFGQFECAQQCFEAKGFSAMVPSPLRYLNFTARLAQAVASLPKRSAPLFSDVYSYAQSRARFQKEPKPSSPLVEFFKTFPRLVDAVRGFRSLRNFRPGLQAFVRSARWWLRCPGSAVEALFLEFGMKDQFLLAMKNRIQDNS